MKRFDDVVVRPEMEGQELDRLGVRLGQHDDRHVRVCTNSLQQIDSIAHVHRRHGRTDAELDVENDQIRFVLTESPEGLADVSANAHVETRRRQTGLQSLDDCRVVVDNENSLGVHS